MLNRSSKKAKGYVRAARAATKDRNWKEAVRLWETIVNDHNDASKAGELAYAYERMDMLEAAMATYDIEFEHDATSPKRRTAILHRKVRLQAAIERDQFNAAQFGSIYPMYGERIWVHTLKVSLLMPQPAVNSIAGAKGNAKHSTAIVTGRWPSTKLLPVMEHEKIDGCMKRWAEGRSWEETGLIERMMRQISIYGHRNKCRTRADVIARYERLDDQFRVIRSEGRLRTREEVEKRNFRELGGVLMHLGPEGEPVFGSRGYHRFAMARSLNLWIPCQIGIVHESALPMLEIYRKQPF
jgi:hypothetical protein